MMEAVGLSIRQIGPMVNVLSTDLDAAGQSAQNLGAVIDQATIRQLASLNDQLSIVSQVLMGQFAPAILMAAIGALKIVSLFRQTQEGLGEIIGSDFVRMEIEGGGAGANQTKRIEQRRKQLEAKGYSKAQIEKELGKFELSTSDTGSVAGDVFAKADEIGSAMDAIIEKIMNWKPQPLPAIEIPEGQSRRRSGLPSASSLVEVGNFLGQSRKTLESLASQQVELLRQIALNTRPETTTSNSGFPT